MLSEILALGLEEIPNLTPLSDQQKLRSVWAFCRSICILGNFACFLLSADFLGAWSESNYYISKGHRWTTKDQRYLKVNNPKEMT